MRFLRAVFLISSVSVAASCSKAHFAPGDARARQIQAPTPEPKPGGPVPPQSRQIFLISDLRTDFYGVLAEGVQGVCDQEGLMEGKKLIVQVLKPALQGLDSAEIIDISFSSIGDLLLSFSAVACPQSGAAWTKTAMRETCRKAGSGSGFQSRESAFGNVSVCGQQYPEQPPVFSEPAKAALLNVQGDKARHVVLVTWKMGSAMPAAKFVEIVRNKLGVGTKVSIAYPKTRSQCVSKKIIPPDNDTSWSDFHPMSLSGGQVFEEIASSTGGRTHDLCNESDFSQTGKTND